jgi:serine phosphatase RsbU (regulator of sigma subunit)
MSTLGGVPLGVNPGALYESASSRLEPDDVLVFFTDGVVEAFNEPRQFDDIPRMVFKVVRSATSWAAVLLIAAGRQSFPFHRLCCIIPS